MQRPPRRPVKRTLDGEDRSGIIRNEGKGGNSKGSQEGGVAPFRPQTPSFCDRIGQVFQLVRGPLTFTPLHMLA